jgi:hypothetical protein
LRDRGDVSERALFRGLCVPEKVIGFPRIATEIRA